MYVDRGEKGERYVGWDLQIPPEKEKGEGMEDLPSFLEDLCKPETPSVKDLEDLEG